MPRHNRPRTRRLEAAEPEYDVTRALAPGRWVETRDGKQWNVQSVSGRGTEKSYVCPGCQLVIEPGVAHVVAWRADGVRGDAADLADRRHWHRHCWKIGA